MTVVMVKKMISNTVVLARQHFALDAEFKSAMKMS